MKVKVTDLPKIDSPSRKVKRYVRAALIERALAANLTAVKAERVGTYGTLTGAQIAEVERLLREITA